MCGRFVASALSLLLLEQRSLWNAWERKSPEEEEVVILTFLTQTAHIAIVPHSQPLCSLNLRILPALSGLGDTEASAEVVMIAFLPTPQSPSLYREPLLAATTLAQLCSSYYSAAPLSAPTWHLIFQNISSYSSLCCALVYLSALYLSIVLLLVLSGLSWLISSAGVVAG